MSNETLPDFEEEIRSVLNRYSVEGASGTPDYILAVYLADCLKAYETSLFNFSGNRVLPNQKESS